MTSKATMGTTTAMAAIWEAVRRDDLEFGALDGEGGSGSGVNSAVSDGS